VPEDIKHIGEKRQGRRYDRSVIEQPKQETFERDYSRYDFKYSTDHYTYISKPGLSRGVVEEISRIKSEPDWMREFRLQAYEVFRRKPLPMWGADLTGINFDAIIYYARPTDEGARSWDDVPEEIKKTFDRLGIPEAERKFLAGVGAQYDSEVVYHNIRQDLAKKGVIFLGMDDGLKEYPEIVKEYFGTVIPKEDNKFAALNSAVWSGGSFIYVPKGVHVEIPLQAYFRINAANMGQFERTLIIADEGSKVHYIEGCVVAGTPIATNPDYKPVETIKVGDRVLTHRGRYRTVRHVQTRPYSGPLFSIWIWGDAVAPLEITEEHPMLAVKRSGKDKPTTWNLEWTTPANLRKGDYLVIPRRKETRSRRFGDFTIPVSVNDKKAVYKEVVEQVPSTPEFFRLAGYFLAEGSILNNFYLSFSFGESERAYIEDVKSLLKQVFGVTKIHELPHERHHGISLSVSSARLARVFAHFGTSSATKRIPDWMLLEEPAKQAQLVVGFFRGDGNYMNVTYPNGERFEKFRLSTTSKTLAYQLRDILLRLGIVASINARDRRSEHRQTIYTLVVGGAFLKPFGDLVGIPIAEGRVGKRATRFFLDDDYAYLPIRNIKYRQVSDLTVYNFSVEADESYVAGSAAVHNCTAPVYSRESLHSAVVELIAKRGAHLRYTTLQNWSNDVYNLVTKRAVAYEDATVEWVDANIGSRVTMKYPAVYMLGKGAKADILSVAYAGRGQHQDAGGKAIHAAPYTTSTIISKSVSKDGGRTTYRGQLKVVKGAVGAKSSVRCDALLLDEYSRSDTYPYIEIDEDRVTVGHEATVGKVGEDQIFYLMSRGLSEGEALSMIVLGFMEPFTKTLPMEYAIEFNRLIQLEMSGSVG